MRFLQRGTVGSTQDEARALYTSGERGPLWLRADTQTAGRGRLSRVWNSARGNFHATHLLPCHAPPAEAALYGFAAALAVADMLETYGTVRPVTLKWPNDVLVGGAKIAGILVEREPEALLIGVGINLVSHPENTGYPATHLTTEMATAHLDGPEPRYTGAQGALAVLAARFSAYAATLERDGFEPLRTLWTERAHGMGEPVRAGGQTGTLTGLGTDGALLLQRSDGTQGRVHAGDVSFG